MTFIQPKAKQKITEREGQDQINHWRVLVNQLETKLTLIQEHKTASDFIKRQTQDALNLINESL